MRAAARLAGALALGLAAGAGSAAAQDLADRYSKLEGVTDIAVRCAGGAGAAAAPCREMALAVAALQRGLGLAAAQGSDIPGTSSTHGRRLGAMPRIGLSISTPALRVRMPRVAAAALGQLNEEEAFALLGLRAQAAAGVLNGLQLAPSIGGILSLDLMGTYALLRIPEGTGLAGSRSAMGVGARVGILRESFTLPGISVSASRHWHGEITAGSVAAGNPAEAATTLTVSSLRATAGKNWFVIGILAGVGWDRYEGDAKLSVLRGPGDPAAVTGRVASERVLYFASGWFNFLITRLSVEVGKAAGVEDPFAGRSGGFDPASGTWFASAAFRVTL